MGGDTAEGTLPLLQSLRGESKGALLVYSVEVDEFTAAAIQGSSGYRQNVREILRSIDVAGDFEDAQVRTGTYAGGGRKSWVAFKLVCLRKLPFYVSQSKTLHSLLSLHRPTHSNTFPPTSSQRVPHI